MKRNYIQFGADPRGFFDKAHEEWLASHMKESVGERKRQLERRSEILESDGEECAETLFLRHVWWPLYGTLADVFPEWEVRDFSGKDRFLDNAYVRYPLLLDMEVDGYGPHLKEVSRWRFSDERRRDANLQIIGWKVIRFSFDDVKAKPLECQHLLKHWVNSLLYKPGPEEEIVRLGTYQKTFTLEDVIRVLHISDFTARKVLRRMLNDGTLQTCGQGHRRVHSYRLAQP